MFKYHSDMGMCFSLVVVVSKKSKIFFFFFFFFLLFLIGKIRYGIGKKGDYFYWEWWPLEMGRKGPAVSYFARICTV